MNTNKTFQYGNEAGGEKEERRCGQTSPTLSNSSALADPLWSKLREFRFDTSDTTFHFATRLAQENGWTAAFTGRVLEEYRRFLFLAMRAGHPVSPSDAVDQAWHLHLLYTESYWGELCPNVLGQPFHHGPSKGGAAEDRKFTDWYERTLDSYARFFGQRPPADIWPPVAIRFTGKKRYQRVCLNDAWVIRKPRFNPRTAASTTALASVPILLAEADDGIGGIIVVLLFILFVIFVFALIARQAKGKSGRRGGGRGGYNGGADGCGSDSTFGSSSDSSHGHGHGHGHGHSGDSSGHSGHSGGHSCGGHGCGGGHSGCGGGSSCGGGSCGGGGCGGGGGGD